MISEVSLVSEAWGRLTPNLALSLASDGLGSVTSMSLDVSWNLVLTPDDRDPGGDVRQIAKRGRECGAERVAKCAPRMQHKSSCEMCQVRHRMGWPV